MFRHWGVHRLPGWPLGVPWPVTRPLLVGIMSGRQTPAMGRLISQIRDNIAPHQRRRTTSLVFKRLHHQRRFPRWCVTYAELGTRGIVSQSFNTKLGCWWFARKLGRKARWIG